VATADGRKTLGHSKAGEKVALWFARLDAAERQWEKGEALREMLRKVVSELEFPPIMAPPRQDDGGSADYEYAHVEQVNLNLLLRLSGENQHETLLCFEWTFDMLCLVSDGLLTLECLSDEPYNLKYPPLTSDCPA